MAYSLAKFATAVVTILLCLSVSAPTAAAQSTSTPIPEATDSNDNLLLISATNAGAKITRLQRVSSTTTTAPGVAPATVTLGGLAPVHGANAEEGEAVKAVLTAYFDDLNQSGGIYNRRISLRFADSGPNRATTVKNARLLMSAPVFAFVAPFAPGAEADLAGLANEKKVPLTGLLALSVPDDPANRQVFYLLPGFEQLVQELGRFAMEHQNVAPAKSAVIFSDAELQKELGSAMRAMWKESGAVMPAEFIAAEDPSQQVKTLQQMGVDSVFLFGASETVTPLIQAADAAKWYPKLFMLGPLLDDSVLTGPPSLQGRMFAVYPALEPNLEGLSEFDRFLERHNISGEHRLLLISAFCAARVLQTALTRAGKNLTREKFLLALEQLHDYRTGLLPPITFGPGQRIGSHKAEFVCLDLLAHAFEPTCSAPAHPQ